MHFHLFFSQTSLSYRITPPTYLPEVLNHIAKVAEGLLRIQILSVGVCYDKKVLNWGGSEIKKMLISNIYKNFI